MHFPKILKIFYRVFFENTYFQIKAMFPLSGSKYQTCGNLHFETETKSSRYFSKITKNIRRVFFENIPKSKNNVSIVRLKISEISVKTRTKSNRYFSKITKNIWRVFFENISKSKNNVSIVRLKISDL
jgi:hypothetical protein